MEFMRGDTPKYTLGWTAAQWTSMAVIVISILFMSGLMCSKWKEQKLEGVEIYKVM
ncbi:hypothetical protein [Paenibacillus guangzhouensis]|uniref:hypothetical protein n=1 Tax=Paenibacillus guangzhouensis TaxID=1473112 RepID=UPI0022393437|nr:hypothetical protein [Paenibacillus guangzhouensis]